MNVHAPKPSDIKPRTLPTPVVEEKKEPVKKPFVRKPHLTDRPFRGNTELEKLRNRLQPRKKS